MVPENVPDRAEAPVVEQIDIPARQEQAVEQPQPVLVAAPSAAGIPGDVGTVEIPLTGVQAGQYVDAGNRYAGQEQEASPPTRVAESGIPPQRTYLCAESPGKSFLIDSGYPGTPDAYDSSIVRGFRPQHWVNFKAGAFTTTEPNEMIAMHMRQGLSREEAEAKTAKWIRAEIAGIEGSKEFALGIIQSRDHLEEKRVHAEAMQTVQFLNDQGLHKEAAAVVKALPHLGRIVPEGVASQEPKIILATPRPWEEGAESVPPQPVR